MTTKEINTTWRQMAAAIFRKPSDGKVSGIYDLDVLKVETAIEKWRAEGHRVTYMHFFMSLIARSLAEYAPELNAYCQWGKTIERDDITVATAVAMPGGNLTTVKIKNADKKTILEIAAETNAFVEKCRAGNEDKAMNNKNALAKVPWPLRKWVYNTLHWLTYEAGIEIPGTGLNKNMFGSVLVSNIGALGIDYGVPALMPASNLSFVFAIGKVTKKPTVIDDEIVIRPMLPMAATFDHRVVDGYHISKLLKGIKYFGQNPMELAEPPTIKE